SAISTDPVSTPAIAIIPVSSIMDFSPLCPSALLPSHRRCGFLGRSHRIWQLAENGSQLLIAVASDFHSISYLHRGEQLLKIFAVHANASMRSGFSDGSLDVGSVDSVAFSGETDPAGAQRIGSAGGNHFSWMVVSRFYQST